MAKQKTTYVCQNCGATSPKWVGKCPSCEEWNTYEEELIAVPSKKTNLFNPDTHSIKPVTLHSVTKESNTRIDTKNQEFNRVLGGGLVKGSITLIGGEPGIGKSTLLLQIAQQLNHKILYVSGEENATQIKMRADRLGSVNELLYILSDTAVENIIAQAKQLQPEIIIVDSVQTLQVGYIESSPGTITQVRESTHQLLTYAKTAIVPVILVGHITKDGTLAGPKILEHIVDTVLQFEGDNNFNYRILRAIKNRFGSTHEIGIYEMQHQGLQQVLNPSAILTHIHRDTYSGIATSASVEGARVMLVEIQALVSSAVYGTPQRSTTGFDNKRLNMLLAVLEKKIGFKLSSKDVFLNLAGGIKVKDTAIDLAVVCAILSSDVDKPILPGTCFVGEIGLSGEIRSNIRIEQRISEAEKLGFNRIFIPKQAHHFSKKTKITIIEVEKIDQVIQKLFQT